MQLIMSNNIMQIWQSELYNSLEVKYLLDIHAYMLLTENNWNQWLKYVYTITACILP